MIKKQLGVQQTGLGLVASPEVVVILVGIEGVQIPVIGAGDIVDGVGTGKKTYVQLPQKITGQVGAAVCKQGKRHDRSSFPIAKNIHSQYSLFYSPNHYFRE